MDLICQPQKVFLGNSIKGFDHPASATKSMRHQGDCVFYSYCMSKIPNNFRIEKYMESWLETTSHFEKSKGQDPPTVTRVGVAGCRTSAAPSVSSSSPNWAQRQRILTPVSFMSISVPKKKRSKLRKFSSLGSPGSCTLDLTLCACRAKATHHRCPDAHNWEDHLKHGGLGCIQLTGLCIHLYIYTKKDNIYLHELKTYI